MTPTFASTALPHAPAKPQGPAKPHVPANQSSKRPNTTAALNYRSTQLPQHSTTAALNYCSTQLLQHATAKVRVVIARGFNIPNPFHSTGSVY